MARELIRLCERHYTPLVNERHDIGTPMIYYINYIISLFVGAVQVESSNAISELEGYERINKETKAKAIDSLLRT